MGNSKRSPLLKLTHYRRGFDGFIFDPAPRLPVGQVAIRASLSDGRKLILRAARPHVSVL